MKYYKTQDSIRAIEKGQEFLIQEDWIEITYEEMLAITNPPKTEEQITAERLAEEANQRKASMLEGEVYTLNEVDYQISFTKDDGNGLVQVKSAFELGLTSTVVHFENGTKMPITAEEFPAFALWFVERRDNFFKAV